MSYRHDIKVAMAKDNTNALEAFEKVNAKHHLFYREEHDKIITYTADDINWNECDEDDDDTYVGEYMAVINEHEGIDYIRIGEDLSDIEDCAYNGLIYVKRTIEVDG